MAHRKNLTLYNVLDQETVFEEYFCNLLRFDDLRDLFIDFINQPSLDKTKINYSYFNTEVALDNENYGRADLFLKYKDKEYIFEIKNKDRTQLTENQPKGYLEYLKQQKGELFFLIPRHYLHKGDIEEQWKGYDKNMSISDINNKLYYWQDFIILLGKQKRLLEKIEIKMFYEFCIYWFSMEPVFFSRQELDLIISQDIEEKQMLKVPTIIKKLSSVINGVVDLGIKIDTKYDEQYSNHFGYVINHSQSQYKINENLGIWFGSDYDIWEKENDSLIIQLETDDKNLEHKISRLDGIKEFKYHKDEDPVYYYSFALIENEDNKQNFYDFIESHLKNLSKL